MNNCFVFEYSFSIVEKIEDCVGIKLKKISVEILTIKVFFL